ncbi:DUF7553 family protein [Halobaculum gomorrense]|uniref:Uncharacterized protein n=1 Tax=Halobaculum gomorrense TaxID=43928 RepID=A0A1M5SX68_9EURY|nr:hypothetical protein [Halobaculum gomorrense]SHH43129.1 hypothetical protein SAMN05443636_2561 [Halobaculum gomorrense]
MTADLLADASDHLRRAADAAEGDVADRFDREADALATAAADDSGVDHGWLAKHTHTIRDAADDAGKEAQGHAEAAVESINEYREGVSGV